MQTEINPRRAPAEILWGQPLPAEHAVQLYSDSGAFLDALEGFASAGLRAGDGVIVIATTAHRGALERRLLARGHDLQLAQAANRYISLDAAAALAQFMDGDWPDEPRFQLFASGLLARARGAGRPVRAFGEMVALLWKNGQPAATQRLEQLWSQLQTQTAFRLFCAYPRSSFGVADDAAITDICAQHSRVLPD